MFRVFGRTAQARLTARYRRLRRNGKKTTVITTAIAREMAAFMWDIARRTMPANLSDQHASNGGSEVLGRGISDTRFVANSG